MVLAVIAGVLATTVVAASQAPAPAQNPANSMHDHEGMPMMTGMGSGQMAQMMECCSRMTGKVGNKAQADPVPAPVRNPNG
jgi:hypothetical protein